MVTEFTVFVTVSVIGASGASGPLPEPSVGPLPGPPGRVPKSGTAAVTSFTVWFTVFVTSARGPGGVSGAGGGEATCWTVSVVSVTTCSTACTGPVDGGSTGGAAAVGRSGPRSESTTGEVDADRSAEGTSGALTAGRSGVLTAGGSGVFVAGGSGVFVAGGSGVFAAGGSGVLTAGGSGVCTAGGSGVVTAGGSGVCAAGGSGVFAAGGSGVFAAGGSAGVEGVLGGVGVEVGGVAVGACATGFTAGAGVAVTGVFGRTDAGSGRLGSWARLVAGTSRTRSAPSSAQRATRVTPLPRSDFTSNEPPACPLHTFRRRTFPQTCA
ncbi:MAG TPA: hypothetical protein VNC85_01855, partial [Mycobacteriales bacterium]|nr:hypothetical protein [Mycobacteriales bacterium]